MWIVQALKTVLKRRRFVLVNTLIVTILAAGLSLILPKTFRSKATVLPPESQSPLSGLLGLSTSQIAMAVTNFSLPLMATPSDLYASMLESETILKKVVDSLDLKTVYKQETEWKAVAALKDHIAIKVQADGIISVEADARKAQLASDIVNSLVYFLDDFNRQMQNKKGKDYSEFLARRLQETDSALTKAQNALKTFQEKNKAVALDLQAEALINSLAQQKAMLTSAEIELEMLKGTLYPTHRDVIRKQMEVNEIKAKLREMENGAANRTDSTLSALDIPLSQVPDLSLRFAILKRDAKIQEAIFEMLSQQVEVARIQERRDTPTIMILDRAHPAELPVKPQKRMIVLAAFFLTLFVTTLIVLITEHLRENRGDVGSVASQFTDTLRDVIKKPFG